MSRQNPEGSGCGKCGWPDEEPVDLGECEDGLVCTYDPDAATDHSKCGLCAAEGRRRRGKL